MTTINFIRNKGNEIVEFTAMGHTNYGMEGEDIVCAAASSIIQTAALGILMVAEVEAEITKDEKKALFALRLPLTLTPAQRRDSNTILNTMYIGLSDLQQNYSDFIEVTSNK